MSRPATSRSMMTRATVHAVLLSLLYTPVLGSLTGTIATAQTAQTTTHFAYDAEGNLKEITQPLSRVTTSEYDQLNRVKLQTFPVPVTGQPRPQAGYGYDLLDNLTSVSDPRKLRTDYTVDGFGNRRDIVSPDTGKTTSTLDPQRNLVASSTDARGQQATYSYDAIGRVTRISYANGELLTFEYDGGTTGVASAKGKLTKMTDGSGRTVFTYDAFGALASRSQYVVANNAEVVHTVRYAYGSSGNANGHLVSMTYPSGNRINYSYDTSGRVSGLTLNPVNSNGSGTNTAVTVNLLNNVKYVAHGPVQSWSWGNSTATVPNNYARKFNLDGRIVGYNLGNPAISGTQRTVAYDAAGRILSYKHTAANSVINPASLDQSFTYDGLDRLISFASATGTQSYSYDANGNRTALRIGGSTYPYTISATSNRLLSTAGPAPVKTNTYDAAGNLTGDGTVSYWYSPRGRMATSTVGSATTYYWYNAFGQRVRAKTAGTTSNPAGLYVYDEAGHLIGEYDTTSGKAAREIVYLGDTPVAVLQHVVTGTAPTQVHAVNVNHISTDHLDTPRVIARASDNKVVWRWDGSDPFGVVQPIENPSGLGTFVFNLRMPGQYYERATNLFYNYFRDYDPQTGRYVQSDPIGLDGGVNTYSYAGGNPVAHVDPTGQVFFVPAVYYGAVGLGVGGALWWGLSHQPMASSRDNGTGGTGALNACPPRPNNEDPCKGKRQQLADHEQKYRNYIENPSAHDNKGVLAAAYAAGNMERYTDILSGRIRNLQKQIDDFRRQLRECEDKYGKP